jgi:AAA+ superfamily predicted ATPase
MAEGNGMKKQLEVLIKAKYPILALVTREELRVERLIREVAEGMKPPFRLLFWSVTEGFRDVKGEQVQEEPETDPVGALKVVQDSQERMIVVMRDFHPFLLDAYQPDVPKVRRALRDVARVLKATPKEMARVVVLLSPTLQLPPELEGDVYLAHWPLPDRAELGRVVDAALQAVPDELQEAAKAVDKERVVGAVLGLSAEEAYSAMARSLVERRTLDPSLLLQEKKQIVQKSGCLEWLDPLPGGLDVVAGMEEVKKFSAQRREAYTEAARKYGLPMPKGLFLAGMPGCGKTYVARAIATAWDVPIFRLVVARLFGSLVGESEANLRKAFETAKAVGRGIMLIDEIDKAVGSEGGEMDGGTTGRVRGELLTWLQDRPPEQEIFVIATANNIELLSVRAPEMIRRGRWDELMFVDLPYEAEREESFRVHCAKRKIDAKQIDVKALAKAAEGFSHAEIEAVVIDAMFTAFSEGAKPVTTEHILAEIKRTVPMSKGSEQRIKALRQWAEGRARFASRPPKKVGVAVAAGGPRPIETS